MNEIIENVKKILEQEANLSIVNKEGMKDLLEEENDVEKKVKDNRFALLKEMIAAYPKKDEAFYESLIQVISTFINQLYERKIDFCKVNIDNLDESIASIGTIHFSAEDKYILEGANRDLAELLFDAVCSILESNTDIKLSKDTLLNLLKRSPKPLSMSIEEEYVDRPFGFERLAKILNENHTLAKSSISTEDTYQLLYDACQLHSEVFVYLVSGEEFKKSHKKIDEILMKCSAKFFVEITNIIIKYFDKDFDRFSIAKKRQNKFCSHLVITLLSSCPKEEDYNLIHQILTDPEIAINYNMKISDRCGESDLKSRIALSGNRIIIKDLLSKEDNLKNRYFHGDYSIPLYTLYAILGEYEKALANFEASYHFNYDLDDEDETWDRFGYAYGGWEYQDSLAEFINELCKSFKQDNIDYSMIVNILSRIINNANVRFLNLDKTLIPIQTVLTPEDLKLLTDALAEKYNAGNIRFLVLEDHMSTFTRYIIRIANDEEVKKQLVELGEKGIILALKKMDE